MKQEIENLILKIESDDLTSNLSSIKRKEFFDMEINSDESLAKADILIEEFQSYISKFVEYNKNLIKRASDEIIELVKNGSKLDHWENRELKIHTSNSGISITLYFNIGDKKYERYEIELDTLKYYHVHNYDGTIRKEYDGKNLNVHDVYKVRFPSVTINLSSNDKKEETEVMKICNYIGKEFYGKELNDGLMLKVSNLFKDLHRSQNNQEILMRIAYQLKAKKDDYLLSLCIKRVKSMDYFNKNNIDKYLMVFFENSEFFEFKAYKFKEIGNKYVHFDSISTGAITRTITKGEKLNAEGEKEYEYRYHLHIRKQYSNGKLIIKDFIKSLGRELQKNSNIVFYSKDEFGDLVKLYENQAKEITHLETLTYFYKDANEKYEELYKKINE